MPILMMILIVCNTLLGYLIGTAISEVLKLSGVENYLGNWGYFVCRMSYGFISCLHGVSYPITLLYFNTKLTGFLEGQTEWTQKLLQRNSDYNYILYMFYVLY